VFAEHEAVIPSFVRVIVMEMCELLCLDLDAAEAVRDSLDVDGAARLAGTLKAFSDPTRLLIVQALAHRELCGCDLGWVTGQSDKVVSHHLGRLRRDGLVTSRREGKVVFASLTEIGCELLERVEALAI
jgi:DNA-binding transcriptional ArsR family regulator